MNNQHFSKLNYFRQKHSTHPLHQMDMPPHRSVSAFDVSQQNKINESYYVWLIGWCFNFEKGTRNDTVCACVRWASEPNGNSSNSASRLRWKSKPKEVIMKGANTHTPTEICMYSSQAENAPKDWPTASVSIWYNETNKPHKGLFDRIFVFTCVHICKCCLPRILIQKNGFLVENEFNSLCCGWESLETQPQKFILSASEWERVLDGGRPTIEIAPQTEMRRKLWFMFFYKWRFAWNEQVNKLLIHLT